MLRWTVPVMFGLLVVGCEEGGGDSTGTVAGAGSAGSATRTGSGAGFSADLAKQIGGSGSDSPGGDSPGSGSAITAGSGSAMAGSGSAGMAGSGSAMAAGNGSAGMANTGSAGMAGSAAGSAVGTGSAVGRTSPVGTAVVAGSGSGSATPRIASGSATGSGSAIGAGSAAPPRPNTGSGSVVGAGSAVAAGSASKVGTGSAAGSAAGSGSVKVAVPTAVPSSNLPRVPVKPSAELAAIKLSLSPNWDRDVGEAGTISLAVKLPNRTDTKVFAFRYGYEDPKAPADRDAYKKWLADNKILISSLDRQRGAAWYLEGVDGSGAPVFRIVVTFGGRKLICGGSLYKDASSNQLGDIRDKTIIQAKEICETVAL